MKLPSFKIIIEINFVEEQKTKQMFLLQQTIVLEYLFVQSVRKNFFPRNNLFRTRYVLMRIDTYFEVKYIFSNKNGL